MGILEECHASILANAADILLDGSSGVKSVFNKSLANTVLFSDYFISESIDSNRSRSAFEVLPFIDT